MTDFSLEVLSKYGISSIIIAVIATIGYLIIDKIKSNKLKRIKNYVALIISVVLQVAFDVIFVKKTFVISEETLTTGVLTGSFATALCVFINKTKNKKSVIFNPSRLAIEGLLEGIVPEDDKESVALCIEKTYYDNHKLLGASELSLEINNQINKKFGFFIEEKIVLFILMEILKLQKNS